MIKLIKNTYRFFLDRINHWLPYILLLFFVDSIALTWANGVSLLIAFILQSFIIYVLFEDILTSKINLKVNPIDILKFSLLRFVVATASTFIFIILMTWGYLHNLTALTVVSAIFGIPLTVYLLSRLGIVLPYWMERREWSLFVIWKATHQKPGSWLLAGTLIYFPPLLCEILLGEFFPYLAVAVNASFIVIACIFSVLFYQQKINKN